MSQKDTIPNKWYDLILTSLNSDSTEDKIFALDFLSQQTSLPLQTSKELMPNVVQSVVHPDQRVRVIARRARNNILDRFPEIEIGKPVHSESFNLVIKEGEKLTAQQILLHKLHLGSRYVVFEAMDRLTESGDNSLVEPLIEYLNQEKDEHKIAYLLSLMGRFDDKSIPDVLEKYLSHEDPRIVANALEALCEFDVPHLSSSFADFAMSSDSNIRCNAVRALYTYSPSIAEKHIAEMVRSNSYTLQDAGVFLLRVIRPSNLNELLKVANNSKYSAIRLKALDIAPPSEAEISNSIMLLREDVEQPNERRDLAFFTGFLILSACLFVITNAENRHLLSLLFLGVGILTLIRPDKTRTSIQKTAISMGFVSSIIWGSTKLMILPAMMGLWLTWNGSRFNQRGKLEKAQPSSIFAWFFAVASILVTQFIQGNYDVVLKLTGNILQGSQLLELGTDKIASIAMLVDKQASFEITIYIFIAVMTIAIMTTDRWLQKQKIDPKALYATSLRRLALVFCVFEICIIVLNVSHVLGLKMMLHSNGFTAITDVLKQLITALN